MISERLRGPGIAGRMALATAIVSACLTAVPTPALAQSWPGKPIRFVVGFTAGSATDSVARTLAEQVRAKLGQPVTVENRPGANGMLGAGEVARAAPDGYTVLVTNSSSITVNPQLYKKAGYDPAKDFVPVTMAVSAPFIVVVNPAAERTASVNTLDDLIELARGKPDQITYGSGGKGNLAHLGFEMLNNRAGIKTTHVPYKAGVGAQLALLGKEIDVLFDTPSTVQNVKAGKLKALAVTTSRRWPDLPNVPTMTEAGVKGFDVSFWLGVLLPAQTPPQVVQALYEAMRGARDDPAAARALQVQGHIELLPPPEFAARIKAETAQWGEIIRRENIQLD